uniref:c-type cytochrome n=1 Tax=Yoonia sp. TaxID=2212373 RepID=UPI0025ED75C4
ALLTIFMQATAAIAQVEDQGFKPDDAEFLNSCASCHGANGKGAGFLTRLFRGIDPGDLTQLAANNDGQFPYDRVYHVIDGRDDIAAHGDRKMPVWGDRYMASSMSQFGPDEVNQFRVRSSILELTNFIQSIQVR